MEKKPKMDTSSEKFQIPVTEEEPRGYSERDYFQKTNETEKNYKKRLEAMTREMYGDNWESAFKFHVGENEKVRSQEGVSTTPIEGLEEIARKRESLEEQREAGDISEEDYAKEYEALSDAYTRAGS